MIKIQYQIIVIGSKSSLIDKVFDTLFFHTSELGLDKDSISIIDETSFKNNYKANAPAVCLYFGDKAGDFKNVNILKSLLTDSTLVIPIVNELSKFTSLIPKELHGINGFALHSTKEIE